MTIKKLGDGRYKVDVRPTGRNGKRFRRTFNTRQEACIFERYIIANYQSKPWQPALKDKRCLSELAELWWEYHGKNLKHAAHRKSELERVIRLMCDPASFQIDRQFLTFYCQERLSGGVKPATINRELFQLSGMFTFLIHAGFYYAENPMSIFKKLKQEVTEMAYLAEDEIDQLLAGLEGDNYRIAVLCLSTGARWGEAAKLKAEHVIHDRVIFFQTKTGKKRTVPISEETRKLICQCKSGYLFPGASYKDFRETLKEIKPDLPNGQATHVMRHTFATYFMINGGSIVTLQRILGHAKIEQTMTYAHFAPGYLSDAATLNPLNKRGKRNDHT